MVFRKITIVALLFISPFILLGQAEALFNGVHLGEPLEAVTQKVSDISKNTNLISQDAPSFPLAEIKEDHLVCATVKTTQGTIERVIFTFADDKLTYIQAKGNVLKTFTSHRKDTSRTYLDYDVYVADRLFLNKRKDMAWILNEEAMHVNLFTWENPYLTTNSNSKKTSSDTKNIPSFLTMGASYDQLKSQLETHSNFTSTEQLDGSDPNAQFQVNCFGVSYLGFPRKIEARFGNNNLNAVWILTAKGEEERIRKALVAQYGDPIYVTDDWEIFNNWQVGLRKDKPEILLLEQQIGLEYKKSYFKQ